jgi:protein involved in polysaccharide export with SLBB domain
MGDTKKIAVIVRDRPAEALRVAGGLTLADDTIEVFILDGKLDKNNPEVATPLELVTELDLKVYSNNSENGYTTMTLEEMSKKLLEYDIVVPY